MNNKQYIITAELSELSYVDNSEIVNMQKVSAKFIDEKNLPLIIISDKAKYDNSNYNTNFYGNIVIKFFLSTIFIYNKITKVVKSPLINIVFNKES